MNAGIQPRPQMNVTRGVLGSSLMIVILLILAAFARAAHADDSVTQTGTFVFQNATGDPYHPIFPPVDVAFPQEFGGTPTITLTYRVIGHCFQHGPWTKFIASNITTRGFRASTGTGCFTPTATWTAVGPKLIVGTAVPDYIVLTVIYAPPGTNGGHSTSAVSYQSGSTAGTTTSSSHSFKTGLSVSVEASGGVFGNGGGAGISFESSQSTTDSESVEVRKSTTSTITQVGPSQDGVNHDEDEIWLLLRPTVNLAVSSEVTEWMLADTRAPVQYVHVGWLNGHEAMPPGVAMALAAAGISPAVYPDILARDPLAAGLSPSSSPRFVPLNTTFPYEPPYSASDPVPTSIYAISNSTARTQGQESEDTFGVKLSVFGTADFLSFAKLKLTDTASWQWTNKSSYSTSATTSQSAQLTIGGPAYGYTGPTVVQVYFDAIYKTFAFALMPANTIAGLTGTLLTPAGAPASYAPIELTENGNRHETVTNSKGRFTFFGKMAGNVVVKAAGVLQVIPQVQLTPSVTLFPNVSQVPSEAAH